MSRIESKPFWSLLAYDTDTGVGEVVSLILNYWLAKNSVTFSTEVTF